MKIETWQAVLGMGITAFTAIGGKEWLDKRRARKAKSEDNKDAKSQDIETYWKKQYDDLLMESKAKDIKCNKQAMHLMVIRSSYDMISGLIVDIDPDLEPFMKKLSDSIYGKLEE